MQQRDGREELALLCAAPQEGTSADWPAVVAFAGLPGIGPSASLAGTLDQRGLTTWNEASLALLRPAPGGRSLRQHGRHRHARPGHRPRGDRGAVYSL